MTPSLIFFDEACSLCWRSIAFVIRIDKKQRFLFAPLNGKTAEESLRGEKAYLKGENSLILIEAFRSNREQVWIRGRAVCRILWLSGGIWKLLGWLCFVPIGIDCFYRLIARHRHLLHFTPPESLVKKNPHRFLH